MSKNDKFTTSPSDSDKVSHDFGSSSSSCGDDRKKEDAKDGIINKIVDYVLKQKWWVVMIYIVIAIVVGLLAHYL